MRDDLVPGRFAPDEPLPFREILGNAVGLESLFALRWRAAHHELAGRDEDELYAERVLVSDSARQGASPRLLIAASLGGIKRSDCRRRGVFGQPLQTVEVAAAWTGPAENLLSTSDGFFPALGDDRINRRFLSVLSTILSVNLGKVAGVPVGGIRRTDTTVVSPAPQSVKESVESRKASPAAFFGGQFQLVFPAFNSTRFFVSVSMIVTCSPPCLTRTSMLDHRPR